MYVPPLDALREQPGFVGASLAVAVLLVDRLLRVAVHDVGVLLLVAGVVTAVWGDDTTRTAGVAVVVAGAGTLVGATVLAALPWGILGLFAIVVVLSLVGVASR